MSEHASGAVVGPYIGRTDPFRFVGYQIKIFDHPTGYVQWRFPRTKKRRIRKKWAKRKENLKPEFLKEAVIHEASRTIICTTQQLEGIRLKCEALKKQTTPHTEHGVGANWHVPDDTQQEIGDTLTLEQITRMEKRMRAHMQAMNFERAYGNIHNSPAFRRQDER